ncbi:unnamed protein product [Adineta steineri]|uniref:Uncharacterized protein n=1 Tax=Adineta steineri TaxID=433720 RepID=A0A815G4A8_9BILA|nr:unnamed protein product [Adineta steineri]CAF1502802.1 unnamed protein product [Adineta steineri]CAF3739078.1 unnamed protein product [Adineta steineri]CAF4104949.1 unnamed protein product [Adineta steineri]
MVSNVNEASIMNNNDTNILNDQLTDTSQKITTAQSEPLYVGIPRNKRRHLIFRIIPVILVISTIIIILAIIISKKKSNIEEALSTIIWTTKSSTIETTTTTTRMEISPLRTRMTTTKGISTTLTTTTTTTALLTTTKEIIQVIPCSSLQLEDKAINKNIFTTRTAAYAIADFNGDNRLDLALINMTQRNMNMLFGNGDGTFGVEVVSLDYHVYLSGKTTVGDFNNDNRIDYVVINENNGFILVSLSNGNGTFKRPHVLNNNPGSFLYGIAVGDFNDDKYLDIAVAVGNQNSVDVYLGKGNGTFFKETRYDTGINTFPEDIVVADFNNDGDQDIAVVNKKSQSIGIFLGYGNGTFEAPKTSYIGDTLYPFRLAFGDFNMDNLLDIVITYQQADFFTVMFGYSNGTVGDSTRFHPRIATKLKDMLVGDFNGDDYLDIAFGYHNCRINMFVGNGTGNFEEQYVISPGSLGGPSWVGVGDFNGDGYKDLICIGEKVNSQYIFLNTCKRYNTESIETKTYAEQLL